METEVKDELQLIRGVLAYMYGSLGHASKVAEKAHMSLDDLEQVGRIAIWKAKGKYNPIEGGNFEKFAFGVIRFDILKELRRKGNMIHIPHTASFEKNQKDVTSLNIRIGEKENEEILNLIPGEPFDEDTILERIVVEEKLNQLTDREQFVIRRLLVNQSQKEIGKKMGLSQMQVSRIYNKALSKLEEMKEEQVV